MRLLPFYGPTLLKISSDDNLSLDIKQNAGIQLKNYVSKFWKFGENQEINKQLRFDEEDPIVFIRKDDKDLIKSNILLILSNSNNKIIM